MQVKTDLSPLLKALTDITAPDEVASVIEDVTDEVADSEASLCWDQAENRLTAMRGLLVYLTHNRRKPTELQIAAAKESLDAAMCRIFCDKK